MTEGTTETVHRVFTPETPLSNGAHTLYVQQRDFVGNWSEPGLREIVVDTTDATGSTGPMDVEPGTWWVVSRHELPYSQLYWNIQINVERGEPVQVHLDRSNATVRPNF